MSLQYYDINLAPNQTQKIGAQGRYIYYYAGSTPLIAGGATPAAAGNQAIKVQAGQSGNTILLMPGQSYRLDEADKAPSEWIVTNFKGAEIITGQVLVGEGDFQDSNTSNTSYVKLDATFANNVKVTNDTGSRVPVSLDTTQTLNVNVAGTSVQYTNAWADSTVAAANGQVIFTPAANVNGAWIEFAQVAITNNQSQQAGVSLIAKSAAPAGFTDGDVIMNVACAGVNNTAAVQFNHINEVLPIRVKIPAGKGLYFSQGVGVPDRCLKTVLYTLL